MGVTKPNETMGTKLERIATLSCQEPKMEFKWLMPHFTEENLKSCFNELDGSKAVGIDGRTKDNYARDLDNNIRTLVDEMKALAYRPSPVREVLIPKGNKQFRPLGISNIEDKIIQLMCCKVLESIYEPLFADCSYGFRRNKSAHMAIREIIAYLNYNNVKVVIDVDLENYFGTIRHKDLLEMLSLKIKDKIFLRYIARLLKAGTQTKQGVKKRECGISQGSIVSPILANIYAHYVIDLWLTKRVPKHIIGKAIPYRYGDDLVICCTDTRDTEKVLRSLKKRLAKFGLTLNKEKTRAVRFNRYTFARGIRQESFDFLGFTFYLSRALEGGFVTVKVKTSKKTLRRKLANVKEWVRLNRSNGTMLPIWLKFCRKLKGHIAYFGVTNNGDTVTQFLQQARKVFFKWMNRRSQKPSINWEKFSQFEKQYPMPRTKIYHCLYRTK